MDTNLVMDLAILIDELRDMAEALADLADRLSKTIEWGIADAEQRGGTNADR